MSYAQISLDITEYIPNTLNFDTFAFVFRSESKDFEDTITVSLKNNNIIIIKNN